MPEIDIPAEGVTLRATLTRPAGAQGLVIIAAPTSSGRLNPRRCFLASELRKRHLATLVIDLITEGEALGDEAVTHARFDVGLLSSRLLTAMDWASSQPGLRGVPVCLFDGPTGPGVALDAASRRPPFLQGVVSIGAGPQVTRRPFGKLSAPVLWLIGERDAAVLRLDPLQIAGLFGAADLEVVRGAGALFEEPGALEKVSAIAGRWLSERLRTGPAIDPAQVLAPPRASPQRQLR